MKFFFLSILFLSLMSCNPFSLDEDSDRGRDKGGNKEDSAKGKPNFEELTNRKKINLDEVRKAASENCSNYEGGGTSILGKWSPLRPIRNCLAKGIDKGLEPVCQEKKDALKLLEYYEDKGDDRKAEETEEYIREIEESIIDLTDEIDGIADEFYELEEAGLDKIDENDDESLGEKSWNSILTIGTKSEVGGIVKLLDRKSRVNCRGNLDFDKVRRARD